MRQQAHIPVEGSKRGSRAGQRRGIGAFPTNRIAGQIHTLCSYRRARKHIYHQKDYKGFGISHSLTAGSNLLHTLEQHPASLCLRQVTTNSRTACLGQWGLTAARTRLLTHRPLFCQDTQQHFFFHSSPRCCRHNRKPSPSSCCKADLSTPRISPREMGDTRPLLSSTSCSVKHRGRCRSWSWSSSNFRQKSKFSSEPLEFTLVFPAILKSSLGYPGDFH